jgi:hypothetical protein
MNLSKLLRKGRLVPVTKSGEHGETLLVGYRRKDGSRKHRQEFELKKPMVIPAMSKEG